MNWQERRIEALEPGVIDGRKVFCRDEYALIEQCEDVDRKSHSHFGSLAATTAQRRERFGDSVLVGAGIDGFD